MTDLQRCLRLLFFSMACAPGISTAAPVSDPPCSVDDLQDMIDDGTVDRVKAGCSARRNLSLGLDKLPVDGALETVCEQPNGLAMICALGARRSDEVNEWRLEIGRRADFGTKWIKKCTGEPDPQKCKDRAPAVYKAKGPDYAVLEVESNRTESEAETRSAMGSLSAGDWTSNLVMGLVDFAIARADAEVSRFMRERVRKEVCVETVRALLPRTCRLMGASDAKVGLGLSFGSAFQAALVDDLRGLPKAIADDLAATEDNLALYATLSLIDGLVRGAPLDEIVATIAAFAKKTPVDGALKRRVRAGLLLLAEARHCLAQTKASSEACKTTSIKLLTALLGSPPTAAHVAMLDRLFATMETITDRLATLKALAKATQDVEAKRALIVEVRAELWLAMAQAIDAAVALLDPDAVKLRIPPDAVALAQAALNRSVADAVSALLGLLQTYSASELKDSLSPKTLRLMSFGADLAAAKTSDDAAAAFDAFAAPVGAWQLKRQAGRTVSFGALVGVSAGLETLRGDAVRGSEASGMIAVTGLVGLDVSWQLLESSTCGLFLGLIDLGGLINTRLSSSSKIETPSGSDVEAQVDSTPEFDLTQILAPSVSLRVGLGETPFVVGAGVEYVPRARSVSAGVEIDEDDVAALRALLFVAIDLPILYF